ncbi:MAG: hypothetical protein J6X94_00595 [Lachnospiraceae bacterium]|nr:hypothetical protein [Lachnospiraceae bacterium]
MRAFSHCAHFHDMIEFDEYIYYSESSFNGLFRYKKDETIAEFVDTFPDEDIWQWDLHRRIIRYEDGLFFIPLNGRGISIYHPYNNQFDFIDISKGDGQNVHFSDTIILDEKKVLLVPQCDEDFMVVNLDKRTVERFDLIVNMREMCIDNKTHNEWPRFSTQSNCRIDDDIYIALYDTSYIYKITLDRKDINVIKLPCDKHIRGISGTDDSIWISFMEDVVAKYDVLSGNIELKEIPYMTENATYPYLSVLEYFNKVVIIPGREDKFILTNRKMDEWELLNFPAGYKREFGFGNTVLTLDYRIVETNLYMYPRSSNGILIYDFINNSLDNRSINYKNEFTEYLNGKLAASYIKEDIIIESVDYKIIDFLMGVKFLL